MQVKKQQLELDMEKQTGFKLGKAYVKALYCHPANLTYMQFSVQFSSVAQSSLTLCDPMNRSTPGLPDHHQLQEFTQTHIHRVSDAIQPSHPLSSPFPPAPNPSQHQNVFPMSQLFASGGQSTGVSALASVTNISSNKSWSPCLKVSLG